MNLRESIDKLLVVLRLRGILTALRSLYIFEINKGHFISSTLFQSVDKNKNPIPWYTYPATEFLNQFDYSQKSIFEFGSGYSTIFWSEKSKKVVSVEDDKKWYMCIKSQLRDGENSKILYAPNKKSYLDALSKQKSRFDIIIIDGSYRPECARLAVKYLKKNGLIILDNSNWYVKTTQFLRKKGFQEIDFFGFGPIVHYRFTTSIFIHNKLNLNPKNNKQPQHPIGSIQKEETNLYNS